MARRSFGKSITVCLTCYLARDSEDDIGGARFATSSLSRSMWSFHLECRVVHCLGGRDNATGVDWEFVHVQTCVISDIKF